MGHNCRLNVEGYQISEGYICNIISSLLSIRESFLAANNSTQFNRVHKFVWISIQSGNPTSQIVDWLVAFICLFAVVVISLTVTPSPLSFCLLHIQRMDVVCMCVCV